MKTLVEPLATKTDVKIEPEWRLLRFTRISEDVWIVYLKAIAKLKGKLGVGFYL